MTRVVTVLCAGCGGLLASWSWPVPLWLKVLVVLLGSVVGAGVAYFGLTRARPEQRHRRDSAGPVAADQPSPTGGPERGDWWADRTSPAATAHRHDRPVPTSHRAPSLSGAGEPPLVAQCPRCGDFRLDLRRDAESYAFRCGNHACAHTWRWTPGTPWPPTVVRRNLTGRRTGQSTDRKQDDHV
ncbi:MAG TPA: hypothetical protein VK735_37405 [Pseudonocardia sp.]|jgi:hypothetical protein|uniref:hypothetical protein n=1 Tax=Pseudonocardia sp. TaxID=60912 RepID=UPI002CEAEE44|nr:hypothetical protein [Pseudonocardia sp.]HTF53156.1 hypothetical protein [Pseudonocardia sp.]